jgi:hypothetical protein
MVKKGSSSVLNTLLAADPSLATAMRVEVLRNPKVAASLLRYSSFPELKELLGNLSQEEQERILKGNVFFKNELEAIFAERAQLTNEARLSGAMDEAKMNRLLDGLCK